MRNGIAVWERHNLVVNSGLPTFARLVGGSTTGQSVAAVGYGSGNAVPSVNDTDLSLAPKYYNPVGDVSYPSSGTVTFSFALEVGDYAAYEMAIQEIGLYANTASSVLPASVGFSYPAWLASSTQAIGNLVKDSGGRAYRSVPPPAWVATVSVSEGQLITDSNSNLQRCTMEGTTGNANPTWSATIGNTTTDGTAIWTCEALAGYAPTTGITEPGWEGTVIGAFTWDNTVAWRLLAGVAIPTPMIAHAVVPAFTFGGSANYSGTWSLTF